jgi:predicted DsbA family dithiol-disulfide isomerase
MHFSDILCIWAYLSQIRIEELKSNFPDEVRIQYHYIPVYGAVEKKLETAWGHRGGVTAYSQFVRDTAKQFPHIEVHPDCWLKNRPASSSSAHLFLKAIQMMQDDKTAPPMHDNRSPVETLAWELRLAFFRDLRDISMRSIQLELAESCGFNAHDIERRIDSGDAFALLEQDIQIKDDCRVKVSPTLIFNEGRQVLIGNVGYKVIEANIHELLHRPDNQATWC